MFGTHMISQHHMCSLSVDSTSELRPAPTKLVPASKALNPGNPAADAATPHANGHVGVVAMSLALQTPTSLTMAMGRKRNSTMVTSSRQISLLCISQSSNHSWR